MEILQKNNIKKIVELLTKDKVVALPTDTVYGFSCLATSEVATNKIYELKQRNNSKQFIVLVSKNYDITKLINVNPQIMQLIKNNTPAPLTMIVQKNQNINLASSFVMPTLAIRIPDDEFLQSILESVGFMVSTSCNLENQPFLNTYQEIQEQFKNLDAIVIDNNIKQTKPSTIIDLTTNPYSIVRQGEYNLKN